MAANTSGSVTGLGTVSSVPPSRPAISSPEPLGRPLRGSRLSLRVATGWVSLALAVAVLVAGCGGGRPAAPVVQWSDYAPEVQTRIDSLAAAKDCGALQDEFDTAEANNAATMSRTGHNNAKLMAYIDYKMDGAGCYD